MGREAVPRTGVSSCSAIMSVSLRKGQGMNTEKMGRSSPKTTQVWISEALL